jgi:hypothetical protein
VGRRNAESGNADEYVNRCRTLAPDLNDLSRYAIATGYYVKIPPKRWVNPRFKYNVRAFAKYLRRRPYALSQSTSFWAFCNGLPYSEGLIKYVKGQCGCKTKTCKTIRRLSRKLKSCRIDGLCAASLFRAFNGLSKHAAVPRLDSLSRLSSIALKYLAAASCVPELYDQRTLMKARSVEDFRRLAIRARNHYQNLAPALPIRGDEDRIACRYVSSGRIRDFWIDFNGYRRRIRRLVDDKRISRRDLDRVAATYPSEWETIHKLARIYEAHPGLARRLVKLPLRSVSDKDTFHAGLATLLNHMLADSPDEIKLKFDSLYRQPWSTPDDLHRAYDRLRIEWRKMSCSVGRVLDRHAQRNPRWAIEEFPKAYETGRKVAPLLGQVLEYLRGLHEQGFKLFFHGRDGELLAQLAHCSGLPIRYAITSRDLTVDAEDVPSSYLRYLEKACPKGDRCAHVDTGYSGSIPEWMWRLGWSREGGIHLVSSRFREYQIPIRGMSPDEVNKLVYTLEHNIPMRFRTPERWKEGICYSKNAPGWWAAFYGAADALGIPYCPSFLGRGKIRRGKLQQADRGVGWLCC